MVESSFEFCSGNINGTYHCDCWFGGFTCCFCNFVDEDWEDEEE